MPRFHVIFTDIATKEIRGHIVRTANASDAICSHPWLTDIYKNTWVAANIYETDEEGVCGNLHNVLGWVALCVNLDEAIMQDLNSPPETTKGWSAGDSNVSSPTQQ